MKAIHRDPGSRGFAVYAGDVCLADGLTQERAWRMVLEGKEPPKVSGGHQLPASFGHDIAHARHAAAWKIHFQMTGYS